MSLQSAFNSSHDFWLAALMRQALIVGLFVDILKFNFEILRDDRPMSIVRLYVLQALGHFKIGVPRYARFLALFPNMYVSLSFGLVACFAIYSRLIKPPGRTAEMLPPWRYCMF